MKYLINNHNIFIIVLVTFLATVILMPIIKKVAIHVNAVDYPNSPRKIHKKPMPRLGGVAIFLSFMLGYMLFAQTNSIMISILIGSFLLILAGSVDSITPLKARYQLIVHIIAASIVVIYGNLVLNDVSLLGLNIHFNEPFNYLITILFIVTFINVMNLIDGLDGLAAGISSIYFLTISIIAFMLNQLGGLDVILALIMLGSTLGFLVYNFPPASCFLGNCGSDFLGFIIGVIGLLGFKGATLTSIVIPICILAIPILDTVFAIFRRLLKGEGIFTPDKEHFHHQLLKMKFSPKTSILIIYFITSLFSAVSIFFALGDKKQAMIIYIILMLLLIFIVMKTDILFKHKKTILEEERLLKLEIAREHEIMNKRKKNSKSYSSDGTR